MVTYFGFSTIDTNSQKNQNWELLSYLRFSGEGTNSHENIKRNDNYRSSDMDEITKKFKIDLENFKLNYDDKINNSNRTNK